MYRMNFDGGCSKNPGGLATFGVVIYHNNQPIWESQGLLDEENTSSNVAEYAGFITGLNYFLENGLQDEEIQVCGDSKLVISQMFRHWQIKEGAYVRYAIYARELLENFSNIRGKLIPRNQNQEADSLTHYWSTERTKVLPN